MTSSTPVGLPKQCPAGATGSATPVHRSRTGRWTVPSTRAGQRIAPRRSGSGRRRCTSLSLGTDQAHTTGRRPRCAHALRRSARTRETWWLPTAVACRALPVTVRVPPGGTLGRFQVGHHMPGLAVRPSEPVVCSGCAAMLPAIGTGGCRSFSSVRAGSSSSTPLRCGRVVGLRRCVHREVMPQLPLVAGRHVVFASRAGVRGAGLVFPLFCASGRCFGTLAQCSELLMHNEENGDP